jgi:catalase
MRGFRLVTTLAATLLAATALTGSGARAQGTTASQTIDIMNKLWGKHPGMRANHAKGVVAEGSFTPTPAAAGLSKAVIFAGKPVPVTVRFSDSTGVPTLPDGSPGANPHGMSIKFVLADGGQVDVVTNSLAFFPVPTGEDFRDLLTAFAASGPDAPKPTQAEQYMAAHPTVPKAFGSVGTPSSFARETYNGVDAFIFVDAAGKRQPFRIKIVPVAGTEHLSAADAGKQAPDFLVDELPKRLAAGPVAFKLEAQLAEPGDPTKDPTQPWPESRKVVDLGTITLIKAPADQAAAQKALRYLPNRLTPGIEVSDDPLIDARVRAYLISFGRRAQ